MQVNQYLYQSPSTNAVQVGRLDPSSQKADSTESQKQNEVKQEAIAQTNPKEQPSISATKIDIYA